MREIKARGWIVQNSSSAPTPALRFNLIAVSLVAGGLALAMTAGTARAADDEDKGFSDKIIDGIKSSIRGTSIDDGRIEYRERSPLVVPPKLDLPPPDTAASGAKAANWPRDPDEGRRQTAKRKAKAKPGILDAVLNPFLPTKPGEAATTSAAADEPTGPPPPPRPDNPTARDNPIYDQAGSLFNTDAITSQLGIGSFNLFGGTKTEAVPFKAEPTRESLTQPPPGYQTPSANFAYGVGVKTEVPRPLDTNSAGERVR
jgi:hypothetical protein